MGHLLLWLPPISQRTRDGWGTRCCDSHPSHKEREMDGAPVVVTPTHLTKNARWMGHPMLWLPPISHRTRDGWGTCCCGSHPSHKEREMDGAPDVVAPTHLAKNARWMGHPMLWLPPISHRTRDGWGTCCCDSHPSHKEREMDGAPDVVVNLLCQARPIASGGWAGRAARGRGTRR
jgi:hypothetical protein